MASSGRSCVKTRLSFRERGKGRVMTFIPGWASDFRIFEGLCPDYDHIIPEEFSPFDLPEALALFLKKEGIAKTSLLGWSLGGYAAQDFCRKYPSAADEVILVGMRKRYDGDDLRKVTRYIARGREGYLYSFYTRWFQSKESLSSFKKGLLNAYLEKFNTKRLLATLVYLGVSQMDLELLGGMDKVKIIHGTEDRIAPFSGALEIKKALPEARFIPIEGAGHAAFIEWGRLNPF